LDHLATDIELAAFLDQDLGLFAQGVFADGLGPSPALSSVLGGSLKPLTCLGATVAVRMRASARSWMAISPVTC